MGIGWAAGCGPWRGKTAARGAAAYRRSRHIINIASARSGVGGAAMNALISAKRARDAAYDERRLRPAVFAALLHATRHACWMAA